MAISMEQSIVIRLICAGCTFLERLLPFLIFRKGEILRKVPEDCLLDELVKEIENNF